MPDADSVSEGKQYGLDTPQKTEGYFLKEVLPPGLGYAGPAVEGFQP